MLSNRSHVNSELMNCFAGAKLLCHLTLMCLPSTSSSTTRLPVFGQLLCTLVNLGSLKPQSGLFISVTQTEIIEMVQALPVKQCLSDPLPTWLLNKSVKMCLCVLVQVVLLVT